MNPALSLAPTSSHLPATAAPTNAEISCGDTVAVYVLEGVKIGCCTLAAVSLAAIKTINSSEVGGQIAARNRKVMCLTATAHCAYFATIIAALIEQAILQPSDANFTALWNQLQLGGACLQTVQVAASSYYTYSKHLAPSNAIVDGSLPPAERGLALDSWFIRAASIAKASILQGSLLGQTILSAITMIITYHKKCS